MPDPVKTVQKRCPVDMSLSAEELKKFNDPKKFKSRLRTYGDEILSRSYFLSKYNSLRYVLPHKKPDTYRSSLDAIPFPKTFPKSLVAKLDINKDGKLSFGKERSKFFKEVSERYTELRILQSLRHSGCNTYLLRREIKNRQKELKQLLPLYKQLPAIDLKKLTVTVYGKTFLTKGFNFIHNARILFEIGEGLLSMPYHVLKKYGMFKLKFQPGGKGVGLHFGQMIYPNTIATGGSWSQQSTIVHEIGHYMDRQLALRLGYKWRPSHSRYISHIKRFRKAWLRHIELALPKKEDQKLFFALKKLRYDPIGNLLSKKEVLEKAIKKQFISAYSSTNPQEWFAEAWKTYWSPERAKVKKYAPDLYALFEKIREGKSLKEYEAKTLVERGVEHPVEISINGSSSVMSLKLGNSKKGKLATAYASLKWYVGGGLSFLYAKFGAGYARKSITETQSDGSVTSSAENCFYASFGLGVQAGHKLRGYFRGGTFDLSIAMMAPGYRDPVFNAEVAFPKFRIPLKSDRRLFLDISITAGIHVFGEKDKGTVVSPYAGGSIGLVY